VTRNKTTRHPYLISAKGLGSSVAQVRPGKHTRSTIAEQAGMNHLGSSPLRSLVQIEKVEQGFEVLTELSTWQHAVWPAQF